MFEEETSSYGLYVTHDSVTSIPRVAIAKVVIFINFYVCFVYSIDRDFIWKPFVSLNSHFFYLTSSLNHEEVSLIK